MPAGYQELFLEQGSNFNTSVALDEADGSPYQLVDCEVKAVMKKSYYSSSTTAEALIAIAILLAEVNLPLLSTVKRIPCDAEP